MYVAIDDSNFLLVAGLALCLLVSRLDPITANEPADRTHVIKLVVHRDADVCLEYDPFGFSCQLLSQLRDLHVFLL